jgi:hypothetical protein
MPPDDVARERELIEAVEAVRAGDLPALTRLLAARPDLVEGDPARGNPAAAWRGRVGAQSSAAPSRRS